MCYHYVISSPKHKSPQVLINNMQYVSLLSFFYLKKNFTVKLYQQCFCDIIN